MDKNKIAFLKSFLTWFAVFYLIYWGAQNFLVKENKIAPNSPQITIIAVNNTPVLENIAQFKITNNSNQTIIFKSPCGHPENLQISRLVNSEKHNLSDKFFQKCESTKGVSTFSIIAQQSHLFELKSLNNVLFNETGKYLLAMRFQIGEETRIIESNTISYEEPGFFRTLFRKIISKPLFNLLAFFTSIMPSNSLGLSIISLTILIRILLFLPNQKAMKSQRKMQKIQPKIEELKRKHGKNQQALALKTMELYKTEKINPMSSCFPMLFQMPFLIGIYHVVRGGIADYQSYLLYSFNNVDLSNINTYFLGLDLEVPNVLVLPVLVASAQFLAVKLSFIAAKKKKQATNKVAKEGMAAQMEQMQKMMLYVMPLMIGFFTATFPAGVGIYWLTSTIFGIFQQKLVNHQLDNTEGIVRRKK
jgi:YidC/Oxa1 family membrane protein insertase